MCKDALYMYIHTHIYGKKYIYRENIYRENIYIGKIPGNNLNIQH